MPVQRIGHFGGRGLIVLRLLGQQQAGFEIGKPRGHHQIIGGDLQTQTAGAGDEIEILID
ncbi:hypothetical protein D3C83_112810 [compost metagenome]